MKIYSWIIIFLTIESSLAGICGFSKWFESMFYESVKHISPGEHDHFDHVCFDMNQILHIKLRSSKTTEHLVSRTFVEINQILKILRPNKSVVFAFDGTAPLAKLLTQRARRLTGRRDEKYKLSPLHITPGTAFMNEIAEAMRYFSYYRLPGGQLDSYKIGDKVWLQEGDGKSVKYVGPWLVEKSCDNGYLVISRILNSSVKIPTLTRIVNRRLVIPWKANHVPGKTGARDRVRYYISGGNIPGEGELKILDWAHLVVDEAKEESVVIVGGDADLILQGLTLTKVKNLFVYTTGQKRTGRLISMWEVVRQLDRIFPGESNDVRNDMIFLLLLNGNDYLPKVRGISFEICFKSYCNLKQSEQGQGKFLIDSAKKKYNWDFLLQFLNYASIESEPSTAEELAANYAMSGPTPMQWLNIAIQKNKVGSLQIEMEPEKTELIVEGSNFPEVLWGMQVSLGKYEFKIPCVHATQKSAKQAAALKILQKKLPDVYEEYLAARELHEERVRQLEILELARKGYASDSEESDEALCSFSGKVGFDVEEYLRGILWTIQMYHDGFSPDYYWRYKFKYAPSCSEMAQWIAEKEFNTDQAETHKGTDNDLTAPNSSRPPLPSDVTCLALMNRRGIELVPSHLRKLMEEGSPLEGLYIDQIPFDRYSVEMAPKLEFDINALLDAVEKHCPKALENFKKGYNNVFWTVVQHATMEIPSNCMFQYMDSPKPPVKNYSEHSFVFFDSSTSAMSLMGELKLVYSSNVNTLSVTNEHIKTLVMPATSRSPFRDWVSLENRNRSHAASDSLAISKKSFKSPFIRNSTIRRPTLKQ